MPTRSHVVPSRPAAFIEARRFVRETAARSAPSQVLDDAVLLTSELVSNAVRHAGHTSDDDPIELTVSVDARTLRVSVRDLGPGFDPKAPLVRSEEGGWGLALVRRLSSHWGVTSADDGTDVWFEIDLSENGTGTGT